VALSIRGVIEGFYGPPWTHADRLDLLGFCGAHELDTWVHAPKDDPYHRERWRDPYPDAELTLLAELAAAATRHGVDFVWSVGPGLSMRYSDDAELATLVAKCEQVRSAGIHAVHLLWDDVEHDLHGPGDEERYGGEVKPSAAAQADVSNRFRAAFRQEAPLVVCPMGYAGIERTPYRDTFARLLDPEILVYWTGPEVVSQAITRADLDSAADSFAHELLLWDNYPVNDFDNERLFLGPLRGRDAGLARGALAGILGNGMVQPVPSKLALATIADFARDPDGYDPLASYERALAEHGPEVVEALRTLAPSPADVTRPEDVAQLVEALAPGVDAATGLALLEPFA
jgi:hyaluronoglucosaminidase